MPFSPTLARLIAQFLLSTPSASTGTRFRINQQRSDAAYRALFAQQAQFIIDPVNDTPTGPNQAARVRDIASAYHSFQSMPSAYDSSSDDEDDNEEEEEEEEGELIGEFEERMDDEDEQGSENEEEAEVYSGNSDIEEHDNDRMRHVRSAKEVGSQTRP